MAGPREFVRMNNYETLRSNLPADATVSVLRADREVLRIVYLLHTLKGTQELAVRYGTEEGFDSGLFSGRRGASAMSDKAMRQYLIEKEKERVLRNIPQPRKDPPGAPAKPFYFDL
jgi:hypothetical protein